MARRGVGEGTFHERPNGLIEHSISIGRDAEGRRLRPKVYGRTKVECRNLMAAKIEEIRRTGGVPLPSDATIATWFEAWLVRKKAEVEDSTWRQYEAAYRLHIKTQLGGVRLDRLRIRDVDAWLQRLLKDEIGTRAAQYARMVLGNALNDAMRLEMIDRNVVSLVPQPSHETEEFSVWDINEALAFLAEAQGCRYYAFWVLWLTTGPRPHEMLGLRRDDVDLDAGELTLTKQLKRQTGERGKMKTRLSRRTLRLSPFAIEALRTHLETVDGEWVFPGPTGGATVYRTLIRDHYEIIVGAARIADRHGKMVPITRVRPYDLRHTYATLALKAGVPDKVVSETLGHASVVTTMRVYAHVLASMREEHVDRIQALYVPVGPTVGQIVGPHAPSEAVRAS